MFWPVLACPGLSCPVLASPGATTTATTLYRLLFIYYLFDMLGVVAWLARDGRMIGERRGGVGCRFVSLCLGCSFFGPRFLFIYLLLLLCCVFLF